MGKNIREKNLIQNKKVELRKDILHLRNQLNEIEIKSYSEEISKTIRLQNEYLKATSVLVFLSYNSEVNTEGFIKKMIADHKKVYAPKIVDFKKGKMEFYRIYDNSIYDISKQGIKEPKITSEKYLSCKDTLCITPGTVFDLNRNRIGYGKGFYDRYFKKVTCEKIGICFDFQIVENLPTTLDDVKLDKVISERRIV